jgi:DNA polymerase-3 subunit gamma/tau
MSYEVLARRFRPQTFDDVEGQRHVVTALRNALRLGRVPHAILFAGPRGVAKTTLARILARALNCDEGPTEKPCGRCSPCLEIANGTSLDVQEIDAASNTGVDNVREIRDSVRYAAAPGKHRIFIIDEVHMLSTAAFNALLKTLEEPPPRSLFIFATTDPQKIPVTVLSRVQRFDLRRLTHAELLGLLRKICAADHIEAPEAVLRAIAREADGSGRDALTLLDRLTSALGQKLDAAEAGAILDLVDRKLVVDVLDAVLARTPAAALSAVRSALAQGVEPARLASELLSEIRDLVVARLVDDPAALLDATPETIAELRARAGAHDAESLQRCFRVLLARMQELVLAPRPEHALEMAVVRLATLPESESLAALVQKLEALDGGVPDPSAGSPAAGGGGAGSRGRSASGPGAPRPASAAPAAVTPVAEAKRAPVAVPSAPAPVAVSAPAAAPPVSAVPTKPVPAPVASAPAPAKPPPADEPPPPDDADLMLGGVADEAPPARFALSYEETRAREAKARADAKAHPRVREVIEALDAELREIRIERAPARSGVEDTP